MSRNLKVLGLALAAAFALSAVAVSSASAVTHTFHTDGPKAFLTAEAENNQTFFAKAGDAKSVVCKKVNVSGAQEGAEVSAGTFASASVTVAPEYSECGVFEAGKELASAKVNNGGCKYKFTGETTKTEGITGEHATVHIEGCKEPTEGITVEVSALNRPCIHVSEQTVHGIRYNNVETTGGLKEITVEATVTGIMSDTTNFALVCPTGNGGVETDSTGTYNGNVIVKGFKEQVNNGGKIEHKTPTNITVNPG